MPKYVDLAKAAAKLIETHKPPCEVYEDGPVTFTESQLMPGGTTTLLHWSAMRKYRNQTNGYKTTMASVHMTYYPACCGAVILSQLRVVFSANAMRRKGIGRAVMETALAWAAFSKYSLVNCITTGAMAPMHGLLKSFNFIPLIGTENHKYPARTRNVLTMWALPLQDTPSKRHAYNPAYYDEAGKLRNLRLQPILTNVQFRGTK